jgi:hypothetical protein
LADFEQEYGVRLSGQGEFNTSEFDWGYRLRGYGLPGGPGGGWLLAHLPDHDMLVAYEIGPNDSGKTGRVVLVRDNFTRADNDAAFEKLEQQPWWRGDAIDKVGGEADLDEIDAFL